MIQNAESSIKIKRLEQRVEVLEMATVYVLKQAELPTTQPIINSPKDTSK